MKKTILITSLLIISLLVLSACSEAPVEQVGCQEDARMCPDGTAVVRIPPQCEFEKCPAMENILSEEILEEDLNLAQGEPLDDPIAQLETEDNYSEEMPEPQDLP
jgi:hypothetical protein